jgi:23S rRNA pseudouridine2605 synthase
VRVNGVVVTELGAKADPEHDRVEVAGRLAEKPAAASYYILNKPPHVVSTMADPEGRATLRHVLRGLAGGVFPVGRLDYATSGLILLTSDGQLADAIFKVSSRLVQVFWMKLKGRPTAETLAKVTHRAQARLRLLRAPGAAADHPANPWYEAELRGARRDLLREALFAAGHPVEKTKRVRLGPLDLGELAEGHYRQLAPSEVALLRREVERAAKQGSEQGLGRSAGRPAVRPFERKRWRPSGGVPADRQVRQSGGPGFDRSAGGRGVRKKFAPAAKSTRSARHPGAGPRFQPSGRRAGPPGVGRGGEQGGHPSSRPSGKPGFGRGKFAPAARGPGAPKGEKHRGKRPPGRPNFPTRRPR